MTLFPIIQYVMSTFTGYGLIVIAGISISWLEMMILYFAIVGNLTAIQRAIVTWKAMTREDEEKETGQE